MVHAWFRKWITYSRSNDNSFSYYILASYVSGGSPVRSPVLVQQSSGGGGAVARLNNNDLDVTSFLPVLTTEYSDIMDESKYNYFCINSLNKAREDVRN